MRFDYSYVSALAEELNETTALLEPLWEYDWDRAEGRRSYRKRVRMIRKLLSLKCEGMPASFSFFRGRIETFLSEFDLHLTDLDNLSEMRRLQRIGRGIVDQLVAVEDSLADGEVATDACIREFKAEYDLINAGLEYVSLQNQDDGLSQDGRTFRWNGVSYSLTETAARIVRVLHGAYMKGTKFLHQEYIKVEAEAFSDMRNVVRDNNLEMLIVPEVDASGRRVKGKWGLSPRIK
jgi:hypothetical protein